MTATPWSVISRMTAKSWETSPASRTADGSSMTMRRALRDSARAMLTICWEAADSEPTSRVGEISLWPRRRSSSEAERRAIERREKPNRAFSWPRKMFSATLSPSTRSSSWYIVAMPRSMAAWG